jgi:hypothetical protein
MGQLNSKAKGQSSTRRTRRAAKAGPRSDLDVPAEDPDHAVGAQVDLCPLPVVPENKNPEVNLT